MIQANLIATGKKWLAAIAIITLATGAALSADETKKEIRETVKKGYLGVFLEKLSLRDKKDFGVSHGVLVTGVAENSPAEKAGIEEDDIIQSFNNNEIHKPEDLTTAVRNVKPGETAKVKMIRIDKPKEVTVTVGENPGKSDFYIFSEGKNIDIPEWKGSLEHLGKNFEKFHFSGGAFLGVELQDLNPDLAAYFGAPKGEGALVLEVTPDSPAQKAGMKAGDVILEIASKKISSASDVINAIAEKKKGEEIQIKALRHKANQNFKAVLDEGKGFKSFNFQWNGDGKEHDVMMRKLAPHIMKFHPRTSKHFEVSMPHIIIRDGHSCGKNGHHDCTTVKEKCDANVHKKVVIIKKKDGDKNDKEVTVQVTEDDGKKEEDHTL